MFKYSCIIYRWKHILLLISDVGSIKLNFEIWPGKRGRKCRASQTMGPQNHVFPSILCHTSMEAQFHPVFIFQLFLPKFSHLGPLQSVFWPRLGRGWARIHFQKEETKWLLDDVTIDQWHFIIELLCVEYLNRIPLHDPTVFLYKSEQNTHQNKYNMHENVIDSILTFRRVWRKCHISGPEVPEVLKFGHKSHN